MIVDGVKTNNIPASDRGLLYGDGLFETLAVREGRPCLWNAHMDRLAKGCERLGFPFPDPAHLFEEALLAIGDRRRGVLKIIVTRGTGGRGYRPPEAPHTRRIIELHPWPDSPPEWRQEGVRLRLCSTRLGINPDLAGIKHLNRLEQVMARAEWDDPAVAEGLMRDTAGHVVEGTSTNLFLVEDDGLVTPDLSSCGVAGVMRAVVTEVAGELGIALRQRPVTLKDTQNARALFLTNALIGIWPVRTFEQIAFDIDAIPASLRNRVQNRAYAP